MIILHFSDLHFGKGWNNLKCQWLSKELIKHYSQGGPTLPTIIITGDITDSGTQQQYRVARKFIDTLRSEGFSVFCCPGNHDVGMKGNWATGQALLRFEEYVLSNHIRTDFPVIQRLTGFPNLHKEVAYISLNSMEGEMGGFDVLFAQGEIGEQQRAALAAQLSEINREETFVILFCHHHPFYYHFFLKLKDDRTFKELIAGQVDVLLFGHRHIQKRFLNKEKKYNIPFIHAAGSTTELYCNKQGKAIFQIPEITIIEDESKITYLLTLVEISPI